jgi:hypothetical protein
MLKKATTIGHEKNHQKIRNPEWRTNARLCFASLAGGCYLIFLWFLVSDWSKIHALKNAHRPLFSSAVKFFSYHIGGYL